MAYPIFPLCFFILFLQFYLIPVQAAVGGGGGGGGGELIFEDGYTVSTVLNGDKSNVQVNPQSILHQSPPSDLFIILDSVASTFYTASLPATSNETVIKRLTGNDASGYVDGDLASAKFNKPKSFTVDLNGNIYVADHRNHAIRKITKSGVTTIAGGYSQKAGHADGPARDATFSDDFELTFISERCALMISDHGNRLVRQISLKAEDCTRQSDSVLGTTSAWFVGVGLSCLISLTVGFVIRPYVMPYTGRRQTSSVHLDMETLANESGETSSDALLRHAKRSC
ncbi:NHL domain-containing protein [Perilla frutescens var. frutescens]|nr:NHL domain-containing protein [Perilla frutescens var. frutescens]